MLWGGAACGGWLVGLFGFVDGTFVLGVVDGGVGVGSSLRGASSSPWFCPSAKPCAYPRL